ncbi:hypothetical protein G9A89_009852 [Geosiphon pyriformis]|nr:hypothetical protein G9A89_009852 [Geosiphon pyriformis]
MIVTDAIEIAKLIGVPFAPVNITSTYFAKMGIHRPGLTYHNRSQIGKIVYGNHFVTTAEIKAKKRIQGLNSANELSWTSSQATLPFCPASPIIIS